MSQRDRTSQFPTSSDEGSSDERVSRLTRNRSQPRGGSAPRPGPGPRPASQGTAPPWSVDPADVDRYLEERAQANPVTSSLEGVGDPARGSVPPVGQPSRPAIEPRPRRSPSDPAGATSHTDDPTDPNQWRDETIGSWSDDTSEVAAAGTGTPPGLAAPRRARPTGDSQPRARRGPAVTVPNLPRLRVPTFVTSSELAADQAALWLLGIAAFGLGVMAAIMSNQLGGLPDAIGIHIDPAGSTDRWGTPSGLWRLPLLVAMITLMNLVAAWFLARSDRFAARFLLAAAVVVQIITWVAVVDFL